MGTQFGLDRDTPRWRDPGPTIGLLLCRIKNEVVAEYAFLDSARPLGISEFQLAEALPEQLQASLPTIERIERELADGMDWQLR